MTNVVDFNKKFTKPAYGPRMFKNGGVYCRLAEIAAGYLLKVH
jgi:hypothetical protein